MSSGKMELRYHPALGQMEFRRWENGRWLDSDPNGSLHEYIAKGKKGKIILQNLGTEFFDTIRKSMNVTEITVDFKGTELDYGDFKSMIDFHNDQNKGATFSIGEFTELKDMESLYQDIKTFSSETTKTLEDALENAALSENHKQGIQEHINNLKDKKDKLDKNTVNLCFVGTYSSGKSTLINAIVGYEILPEALKSETAKMFRVSSVGEDTGSYISFTIVTGGEKCIGRIQPVSATPG